MRLVDINHVTLDGVMQSPGRPEEDTRGGFTHGGWASARSDGVLQQAWGERLTRSSGFLFGRRTYEGVLGYWNTQDSPFRDALNQAPKYVASTREDTALPWPNSTLLTGDVPAAVARLKDEPGPDLHIMGSGELIRTLHGHDLIDEFMLSIHPIVLCYGRRLFDHTVQPAAFGLADVTTTSTGVVIASYRRDRGPAA
jgi:dihydrofolate reductase